ncbi:hypothetical protein BH10PSE19_BH10PSE19_16930 [soil metagenome]
MATKTETKSKTNKTKRTFLLRRKNTPIATVITSSGHSLENLKSATLNFEHDTVAYIRHNPLKVAAGSLLAGTLLTLYFLKEQLLHLK